MYIHGNVSRSSAALRQTLLGAFRLRMENACVMPHTVHACDSSPQSSDCCMCAETCFVVLSKLPLWHKEAKTDLIYSIYIVGFVFLSIVRLTQLCGLIISTEMSRK